MDLDAEMSKCEKKLSVAQINADKLRKVKVQPDYESTVPESVRDSNAEKVIPFPTS